MRNRARNKILAFALAAAMMLGMFTAAPSMTAYAAGPIDIQEGLPSINVNTASATVIGFAGHEWVVIGDENDGVKTGESDSVTLLLKNSDAGGGYGAAYFKQDPPRSNEYSGSDLKVEMESKVPLSSSKEYSLINPRDLGGGSGNFSYTGAGSITGIVTAADVAAGAGANVYTGNYVRINSDVTFDWYTYHTQRTAGIIGDAAYTGTYHPDRVAGSNVTGAKFWPLSLEEASLVAPALRTYSGAWWLRSPGYGNNFAAYVYDSGLVSGNGVNVSYDYWLRPAFILDLSSVIFTSAAAGGKSDATAGSGLVEAESPTGAVKLTVEDNTNLSLTGVTPQSVSGRTITFGYAGATAGKTLSAIVKDSSGEVKYYGQLADGINASGSASVTVPDDVTAADELLIFVEEINAPYYTDYACTPIALSFSEQAPPTGLTGVDCSTAADNDGKITGTTTAMEYSDDNGATWTTCADTEITDLAPGSHLVRYAGKVDSGTACLASDSVPVTVSSFTNNAPNAKSGEETQTGSATPASGDNTTAAVPYTADVSDWFEDADGDILAYDVVSTTASGTVNLAAVTGALTYTPAAMDASSDITIIVKANDGTADSTGNVTITISVGAIPPDATVNTPPSFTQHPGAQNITEGQNAVFMVSDSGNPVPLYQWQEKSGSGWADIGDGGVYSGATDAALTLTSVPLSMDGYQYRCVASNGKLPDAESNPALLSVSAAGTPAQPGVSTNSISIDLRYTNTASFNVSLGMSGGSPVADKAEISVNNSAIARVSPNEVTADDDITVTAYRTGNTTITVDYFSNDVPVATQSTVAVHVTDTTPSTPTPGRDRDSDSGGGSSVQDTIRSTIPSTLVVDAAKAKAALAEREKSGAGKARIRHNGEIKILAEAWPVFGNIPVDFDTLDENAVAVRVTVREPGKMTGEKLLSGYVKGSIVDSRKAFFEKWFKNKVRVIHLDQQGDFGQPVKIAAKLDLTGMDASKLYFYSYDKKTNTYRRIEKPAYWIDKNGYLHFTTEYAGDIVVSEGPLERK